MAEWTPIGKVTLPVSCRVRLTDGTVCGYQGQGATPKDKIQDLFRHQQQVHIEGRDGVKTD